MLLARIFIIDQLGVYVYAIATNQVVQASLGYFINPLVSVALGYRPSPRDDFDACNGWPLASRSSR